ncbi:glycosyltransferase family 4 protein [Candidatus Babeliales bacterium]|nr:glycosyltransferase family 4 protein [Candidatus Babeliales bacterium]
MNKSKPKIAILTIKNSYEYGGVLSCVKVFYKFCEKYFDPTIFVLSFDKECSTSLRSFKFSSSVKQDTYCGMKCVEIGSRWAFWEPGHYVYTISHWQKALKDFKYFFVVGGSCISAYPLVQLNKDFVLWFAASYQDDRSQRVKKLSWFRYFIDKFSSNKIKKIEKEILKKVNCVLPLSKDTKLRMEEILKEKRNNVMICNFPIKHKKFSIDLKTKKEKNIIAVGRFSDPRKNIKMLFRVFDKLYSKIPELKLFIIGKKPSDKILKEFSLSLSFKNIVFTGEINGNEIDKFYKCSCLMFITSYQEGLGIVGLEAFSHGIPVVATDCGGTREYVINDYNGYLVKVNDDIDMIEKSLKILSSNELNSKMGKNAIKFVEQNFSKNKIHSIFKAGLCSVYPDLKKWFEQCDLIQDSKIIKRTNKLYEDFSN